MHTDTILDSCIAELSKAQNDVPATALKEAIIQYKTQVYPGINSTFIKSGTFYGTMHRKTALQAARDLRLQVQEKYTKPGSKEAYDTIIEIEKDKHAKKMSALDCRFIQGGHFGGNLNEKMKSGLVQEFQSKIEKINHSFSLTHDNTV